MINFTPIVRPWFLKRVKESESWLHRTREVQTRELDHLLAVGRRTLWGVEHGLEEAWDYDSFRKALPKPVTYPELRPWIMRMIEGEKDILWEGVTMNYAQSSGTSDGKSKYIPITDESFHRAHYKGERMW